MANPNRLTTEQCVELIASESGSTMTVATFRGYVSRGQAPQPVEHIGRTPLYNRREIIEWANNRPGIGARTDLRRKGRPRRAE